MTAALDVAEILRRLDRAGVEHVLIGDLAVNAHGVIRATKHIDICPSPDPANLERLAAFLRDLDVQQLGVEDESFSEREMPYDPHAAADLAEGGNFRLDTPLGVLDIMQLTGPRLSVHYLWESVDGLVGSVSGSAAGCR